MRDINSIVIHCSDSPFGDVEVIRDWHVNGNGWADIGYHYVVLNGHRKTSRKSGYAMRDDGLVESGRPEEQAGSHVLDRSDEHDISNGNSIGICMVGDDDGQFTPRQAWALLELVQSLQVRFNVPTERIIGHREADSRKTCPGWDVETLRGWLEREMVPFS